MPDDTANTYQGDSITIDLTLMATQSSYITINTVEDFKKFTEAVNSGAKYDGVSIANNPEVYVKLTDDIDLSEYTDFYGIGDGEDNSFDGVFDGCDHTIKNWTADNQNKSLALFRTTKSADIKNLTIDNFIVGADTTKGSDYGILIGLIKGGDVVIDKVSIKNSVLTGQETIGVIVGAITEGHLTITNCNVEEVTIKNADGYTDVVGVLLGNGYSKKGYSKSGFTESKNKITNVKWFNADVEQTDVPACNYNK